MKKVKFQVDTRLAKLLSENYRSIEIALKELIDNSWDADAELVKVYLPDAMTNQKIVIHDDGSGMTEEEISTEYLNIASNRRKRRGELTYKKKRKVKGRKGIGKFAGLAAANTMLFESWARAKKCQFSISTSALDSSDDIEELPIEMSVSNCDQKLHGTRITLSPLHQNMAFPNAEKFCQILLQEYGREEDFKIDVNGKIIGIEDISGNYSSNEITLPQVGKVKLKLTISDQRKKLKRPGISIRVGGKIVGKPGFFGLEKADDFPEKLLHKIYGEVEVDGLRDHVTADWGAFIENSELYNMVIENVQPIIREKVKNEYHHEISLAQARLQKKVNDRLALLPEYKREYADKAIKKVLNKYYGEPEAKIEPVVSVLLDALERTDYRAILDYIHEADRTDITKIAEILNEFGLAELAILGGQVKGRLEFLDRLEELCQNPATKEDLVHKSLSKNLWVLGSEYSLFSSNQTLKRIIKDYLNKRYIGSNADKRPDLMLSADYDNKYLLIEFKRPKYTLKYKDYQQATGYRNAFKGHISSEISVLLIGGHRSSDLPNERNIEPNVSIRTFDEIISHARNKLNWTLKELGGEAHA